MGGDAHRILRRLRAGVLGGVSQRRVGLFVCGADSSAVGSFLFSRSGVLVVSFFFRSGVRLSFFIFCRFGGDFVDVN